MNSLIVNSDSFVSSGGKFLRFARDPGSPITRTSAHEYAEEFASWRKSLPDEFSITRISTWSSDNVWIVFLLAMSYRLECLFYRIAREHFKLNYDGETLNWCQQQLIESVFELDTLINRAIVHDVVKYMPASL
jgi:hypothetical protein